MVRRFLFKVSSGIVGIEFLITFANNFQHFVKKTLKNCKDLLSVNEQNNNEYVKIFAV